MVADGHTVDTTHHSFTLTGFELQKFLKKGAWEGGREGEGFELFAKFGFIC